MMFIGLLLGALAIVMAMGAGWIIYAMERYIP